MAGGWVRRRGGSGNGSAHFLDIHRRHAGRSHAERRLGRRCRRGLKSRQPLIDRRNLGGGGLAATAEGGNTDDPGPAVNLDRAHEALAPGGGLIEGQFGLVRRDDLDTGPREPGLVDEGLAPGIGLTEGRRLAIDVRKLRYVRLHRRRAR